MPLSKIKNLRENQTFAERKLWQALRNRQIQNLKFRRQVPIGNFVADFACLEKRIVVEVDGGQHAVNHKHDSNRTQWLKNQGFKVLRFWNNEVLGNLEGVLKRIIEESN